MEKGGGNNKPRREKKEGGHHPPGGCPTGGWLLLRAQGVYRFPSKSPKKKDMGEKNREKKGGEGKEFGVIQTLRLKNTLAVWQKHFLQRKKSGGGKEKEKKGDSKGSW